MPLVDRRRQHDDLVRAARRERKSLFRRAQGRERPKLGAQPADFDPEPRAMRLVGVFGAEGARDERASGDVAGPGLGQRTGQREQDRARRERNHRVGVAHDIAARVHDQRSRLQQRLDFVEQKRALFAARDQPRRGHGQQARRAVDLRRQRRDGRCARGLRRPGERRARHVRLEAPNRDAGDRQLVRHPRRGRQRRGVERRRARVRPRPAGRSGAGAGPRDCAHGRRSPCRHARRASRARHRALWPASRGRARPARSRPRRRRIAPGPPPPSDRRRAPRCAAAPSPATRSPSCAIAMPRSASAAASLRRATRFNAPSGSPPASARAAAVISESIELAPHLSLSPVGLRCQNYLTTNSER